MFDGSPSPLRDRKGLALPLLAVSMMTLLAVAAIAIDLGMLLTARAEAQRAADSAALAGASAFLDFIPATAAVDTAQDRAIKYAMQNTIRNVPIAGTDLGVNVDPANLKVTVAVRSVGLPMWFGSLLGPQYRGVTAEAAAVAAPAGGAKCVLPFAIPDSWSEITGEDVNGDRSWGNTEAWDYNTGAGDNYKKWNPAQANDPTATGYSSQWRHQIGTAMPYDDGLVMTIKAQQPGTTITSGFFYPWRLPGSTGANDYKWNIINCNPAEVYVGQPYDIEPGNMVGPTRQAIQQVMNMDAGATWDPLTSSVSGSAWGANWQASPRVLIAGLFDPGQIAGIQGSSNPIVFNDFGLFFLEGFDPAWPGPPPQAPVQARFLGFAKGTFGGTNTGSLLRILRLVE